MAVKFLACAALLAVAMAPTGCSLDLGDSPFLCNKGGKPECPAGYECKGTYCVQEGTCPSTVPGCGGTTTCGDNKCEAGEKTSCPKDCPGTNNEAGAPDAGPLEGGAPPPDMMPPADTDPWPPDQPMMFPDQTPTQAGYGSKCLNGFPPCQPGYDCVAIGSATTAFCTKTCTSTTGGVCSGSPPGTEAYCLLENSTTGVRHCAFLCKLDSQTWSCPGNLTCSPAPNPPGSTQYPCMP